MSRIVSAVPGRIRVRDQVLRQPQRLARLEAGLARIPGVESTEANHKTGSLVVHYDAARVAPTDLEARVEQALDAELAAPRPHGNRSLRVKVNRVAKAGMLGSLAASLALAAAGQKRWHAVSGGLFVACLGVHLGVHRRHVLR